MSKKNKNKGGGTRKNVLSDHLRIGRRFVPPMLQISNLQGISISQRIIPEFFWMALLNDYYGWQGGAKLSLSLARAAAQATGISPTEFKKPDGQAPKELFATTSAFRTLNEEQKKQLIRYLKLSFQWESLVKGLSPLVSLYPECPLNFLFEGAGLTETKEDLAYLKGVLKELFDKYTKQAVSMFANATYIAFCTNKLRVFEGSLLSKFPAIEKYPETEESRAIAAAIRAGVYGLFSDTPQEWGIYFWNRGLDLESCSYDGVVNDEDKRILESD